MDAPLLEELELHQSTVTEITIETVRNTHHQLLNNEGNTQCKMREIVNILGGTDVILTHYLSEDNLSTLSNKQLNDINQILLLINLNKNDNKLPGNDQDLVLSLSRHHTFLHDLFSNQTAHKIIHILFGRIAAMIFSVMLLSGIILSVLLWTNFLTSKVIVYLGWLLLILALIALIIALLSVNKLVIKMVSGTFEFWFKLFFLFRYFICTEIYSIKTNRYYDEYEWSFVLYINIVWTVYLLFILIYSFIDGLQISIRFRIFVLITGSMFISTLAIYHTILETNVDGDGRIIYTNIFGRKIMIDIIGWSAGSLRIISLFVWRQTIYSLYYRDKATSINQQVSIKWVS